MCVFFGMSLGRPLKELCCTGAALLASFWEGFHLVNILLLSCFTGGILLFRICLQTMSQKCILVGKRRVWRDDVTSTIVCGLDVAEKH